MARYVYPAVFSPEGSLYNVTFPDFPDAVTCGDDLADAMYMAKDLLSDILSEMEENKQAVPAASSVAELSAPAGCAVSLVLADTDEWRRAHSNKAVKKTLTIPQWLNTAAEARGVNFSQVLQDALRSQLQL